jgi:hypothetical protein
VKWSLLICGLIGFGLNSSASETSGSQSVFDRGHFHFVTFKCALDKQEGPESTAQSPPLNVDDPGTPGCNQWEANLVADGDLSSGQRNLELPLLDLNYGIGDNLQLKYEIPYVSQQASGVKNSAIGESKVGLKYMFYENEEADLQLAVYPQLSFASPDNTAVDKGISTPGKVLTLPLLYTQKIGENRLGNINLTANLGYNLSTKSDITNFVNAAIGIAVPVHRKIAIMGEISSQQGTAKLEFDSRQSLVKLNAGLIATVSRTVLIFASAGRSVYTSDQNPHSYVLAGLRLSTKNVQE